jgi:asparagine synthase (glutamine-hydrolysing)
LTKDDFESSFPAIVNSMDLPSCDGVNTWFISRHAKQTGLKAVLSGIGADELFGGYPSFKRIGKAEILKNYLGNFARLKKKSDFKQLNRISYLSLDGIKGIYLFLRGHFSAFEIASHLGASEAEIWDILNEQPRLGILQFDDERNEAGWLEFNLYMQNQLLRDADVMSMIHGLEIRVPFLDTTLIDLAMSVHPVLKFGGENQKQLLISAFGHLLPEEVWNRPKMGFSLPFNDWMTESGYVREMMCHGSNNTQAQYQRFLKGKLHWSQLMSLINLRNRGYA